MALETFFSVTPKSPSIYTYNPSNPNAPHVSAYLYSWGGMTFHYGDHSLTGQYNNNEIIVGYDPVGLSEQTIANVVNDAYKRNVIRLVFNPRKVGSGNQLLLLFALRGIGGNPNAQFFLGTDLIRTQPLAGNEQVAILMDCPPGDYPSVTVYVRLASDNYWAEMGFQGVDCYLL